MNLIYIISMSHSGSTLMDCILGTHPQFLSTGEMRYLGWQLERTKHKIASIESQDICTCGNDFLDCIFWSQVIEQIHEITGIDFVNNPRNFHTSFFNQFAYQDRGKFTDRIKGYLVRQLLEQGGSLRSTILIEPRIKTWLYNSWLQYEIMSGISGKPIILDSSKHLTRGLLLQQSRQNDVYFIFIHRSAQALMSSSKRWKQEIPVDGVIKSKRLYEKRVHLYKQKVNSLQYFEATYKEFVRKPATFLKKIVTELEATDNYPKQSDENFFIDPSQLHLVAGNPMRYRGRQRVRYDARWKWELSEVELHQIEQLNN